MVLMQLSPSWVLRLSIGSCYTARDEEEENELPKEELCTRDFDHHISK
jgi:hypothetical protein